jgi:putative tricarboxylic transport membrane protein
VPFDGGGELLASVLGGKVAFGISGIGEHHDQIRSGELRLPAVTGPEWIKGFDAPTLRKAGLDVSLGNWRGIVPPPGLSEAERDRLVTFFTKLHDTPQ